MVELPPITLRLRGRKVVGRVAFALLLLGSIAVGALAGLIFVYSSDLPQIRALEDFRPDIVTELYADDGQVIGTLNSIGAWTLRGWRALPGGTCSRIVSPRAPARLPCSSPARFFSTAPTAPCAARFRKLCWPYRSSVTTPSSRFLRCTVIKSIYPTATTDLRLPRNIISASRWASLRCPRQLFWQA